eukprot:CAMPEP_0171739118 /NCGR_PEP_ID=MMETSP0991-20121206/34036_1 /TAXON_ID=483369 /ORGANISM="non described non described, Strain CCMP2098" /LENGTH=693 /DNA_ID=CAMNT_0012336661 /DNA_START=172 /DNA_END=2250 /DNA_ORIENTATION=-
MRTILGTIQAARPDLLVMNWGAHYGLNTASNIRNVYRDEADKLAKAFAKQKVKPSIVVYRTTPPGHPACGAYLRPLCSDEEHRKQFVNPSSSIPLGSPPSFKWEFFEDYNHLAIDAWRKSVPEIVVMDTAAMALSRPDLHVLTGIDLAKEEKTIGKYIETDCLHFWKKNCGGHREMNEWWITLLFNILNLRSSNSSNSSNISNSNISISNSSGARSFDSEANGHGNSTFEPLSFRPSIKTTDNERCLRANVREEIAWIKNPSGFVPSYDGGGSPVTAANEDSDGSDGNVTYQSCHDDLFRGVMSRSMIYNEATNENASARSTKVGACSSKFELGCLGNNSSGPLPRVAHCVAGSARTLWHPKAYKQLQDNFIDALGGDYNTFMFLKLSDSKATYSGLGRSFAPELESLSAALAYMHPTKLVFAPEKPASSYSVRDSGCTLVDKFSKPVFAGNILGQMDTLRDCYRLVEEFEVTEGIRFDFVTRIRPDTAVLQPVQSIHSLSPEKFYLPSSLYIDHIGIFGRSISDEFFHIVDQFYGLCPGGTLTWLNHRGNTDIQAHFFESSPFLERRAAIPIPVILIRPFASDMQTMCRMWVKMQPAVFGKPSPAAERLCFENTKLTPVKMDNTTANFNFSALHFLGNISDALLPILAFFKNTTYSSPASSSATSQANAAKTYRPEEIEAPTKKAKPPCKAP